MKNVISCKQLYEWLGDPDVRVIDCRFELERPNQGRELYMDAHIPGSIYFHLDEDMSGVVQKHGGRHPLPNMTDWIMKLNESGITEKTKVVAYDDQGGAMASRLWWLLKYVGHESVQILDGGFVKWQIEQLPVTSDVDVYKPVTYTPSFRDEMIVNMNQLKQKLHDDNTIIIDSRHEDRYKGLFEPIDAKAGHIPGTVNYFWKLGLTNNNEWKSVHSQIERYAKIHKSKELIVYCGSGVTACSNIVTLDEAGFDNVKLYAGSWSDWISYPFNPVERFED
jgi:thiosulfate/3-mercaptopyruvate sulfurtransferase